MQKKAIVLLSGGIDSAVALALTINKYGKENVETLVFNYGQRNINEIKYSKLLSEHYGVENTLLDISNIFSMGNSSLLKNSSNDLSHLTYEEQVKKSGEMKTNTNIPFRNGVFLSIAASIAISKNMDVVVYGIHFEPGIVIDLYPDCTKEFNDYMYNSIYVGSGKQITIEAPFVNILKPEVVKIGIELKIPFEKIWTCYDNQEYACGKCNSCKDRINAFKANNYIDPIKYL